VQTCLSARVLMFKRFLRAVVFASRLACLQASNHAGCLASYRAWCVSACMHTVVFTIRRDCGQTCLRARVLCLQAYLRECVIA
jgi:hypothetical protein